MTTNASPERERVAVLQAQMKSLQDKLKKVRGHALLFSFPSSLTSFLFLPPSLPLPSSPSSPSLPLPPPPLQNADLQVKLDQVTSKQQKEKEEWTMKQRALQDQLSDIHEECRLAMITERNTL